MFEAAQNHRLFHQAGCIFYTNTALIFGISYLYIVFRFTNYRVRFVNSTCNHCGNESIILIYVNFHFEVKISILDLIQSIPINRPTINLEVKCKKGL